MRDKKDDTTIIFVRHGKTDFPHDRLYCDDREDPPLNELGLQQAQQAASLLRDLMMAEDQPVAAIYTSPLQRTKLTAEAIARSLEMATNFDAAFKERPMGIWDGMSLTDIAEQHPDGFQAWKRDPVGFAPQGGETLTGLLTRTKEALDGIIKRHRGKTIIIVSHVGPIRVLLCDALSMPLAGFRQLTVDYGSLTRMDYGPRQNNFIYLNRKTD